MLKRARLKTRLSGQKPKIRRQMCLPDGVRVYAIGDVHGRSDLLRMLLARIETDAKARPTEEVHVVFLGDYVDRGPDSKGVIDLLLRGLSFEAHVHHLKGNHEDALLTFLDDPGFLRMWGDYGGMETLVSYGVQIPKVRMGDDWISEIHTQFKSALPKSHLAFMRTLETSFTIGDYFFAHAGARPGVPLEEQQDSDLLWIRDQFLSSKRSFGKLVVHGHTPQEQPVIKTNRIGIDTGAYITGTLTTLVAEGTTFRFLQSRATMPAPEPTSPEIAAE